MELVMEQTQRSILVKSNHNSDVICFCLWWTRATQPQLCIKSIALLKIAHFFKLFSGCRFSLVTKKKTLFSNGTCLHFTGRVLFPSKSGPLSPLNLQISQQVGKNSKAEIASLHQMRHDSGHLYRRDCTVPSCSSVLTHSWLVVRVRAVVTRSSVPCLRGG